MESRVIEITQAAFKYGNLNIRSCGLDFFPEGIVGGPTEKELGTQVTIKVEGLKAPVKTDIPVRNGSKKPRWIFRERSWVKEFVRAHKLKPGDTVTISRVNQTTYDLRSGNGNGGVIRKPALVPRKTVSTCATASDRSEATSENSGGKLKKWVNTVQCMDCIEGMKQLPANCIDLVVTSPPYDSIRKYNGFSYDLHATGVEILRILKDGGIAAMVIQDQTRDFAKTLTSFRTIVDWCDNIGFRLFECVIYRKHGTEGAWWVKRFRVAHEYMPIFLKGKRPAYFDKEPLKVRSKHGGKVMTGSGNRRTDGETTKTVRRSINRMKCRGTVWNYLMAGDKNPLKRKHPAVFPDQIPYDFIQCFCPP